MAKHSRIAMHRTAASLLNNVDKALANLMFLQMAFDEHHPDYSELLEKISVILILSEDLIYDFCKVAWWKSREYMDNFRGKENDDTDN